MRRPLMFALVLALSVMGAVVGAYAEDVEPLGSWTQTVIAEGKPLKARQFDYFANIAGIPPASRQDTLRRMSISNGQVSKVFFVRRGPSRTDVGVLVKPSDKEYWLCFTNPRGDLKWAGRREENEGFVSSSAAREKFAAELKFWQGYEEFYNRRKAEGEDGS